MKRDTKIPQRDVKRHKITAKQPQRHTKGREKKAQNLKKVDNDNTEMQNNNKKRQKHHQVCVSERWWGHLHICAQRPKVLKSTPGVKSAGLLIVQIINFITVKFKRSD